ncbi:hypothetical protein JCM10212_001544 [Sporobolomyces blumeae]
MSSSIGDRRYGQRQTAPAVSHHGTGSARRAQQRRGNLRMTAANFIAALIPVIGPLAAVTTSTLKVGWFPMPVKIVGLLLVLGLDIAAVVLSLHQRSDAGFDGFSGYTIASGRPPPPLYDHGHLSTRPRPEQTGMDLLSDHESRAFSSFLDSFAGSTSPGDPSALSPPPPPAQLSFDDSDPPAHRRSTSPQRNASWSRERGPQATRDGAHASASQGGAPEHGGRRSPSSAAIPHAPPASIDLNHWTSTMPVRRPEFAPPPPPPVPSSHAQHPSSSSTAPFNAYHPHPLPHLLPPLHSYHAHPNQHGDPFASHDTPEQKRQKKQQQLEDLERWMAARASTGTSGDGDTGRDGPTAGHRARDEVGVEPTGRGLVPGKGYRATSSDEIEPPRPKRTKSSGSDDDEPSSSRAGGRDRDERAGGARSPSSMQGDPIAMMLEAERRAGYAYGRRDLNDGLVGIAKGVAPSGSRSLPSTLTDQAGGRAEEESMFAPPPPPASASKSKTRRVSSAKPDGGQVEVGSAEAEEPQGTRSTKRKTAPSRSNSVTSSSKTRASARASGGRGRGSAASGSASRADSADTQAETETAARGPDEADMLEEEPGWLASVDPVPAPTPSNIPRPPPRPRRPSRAGRQLRRSPSSVSSASASTSQGSASTSRPSSIGVAVGGKPALLTSEQKKLNHIASEQKRRAAIRKGYDGLCQVVPVLRVAVEEFEERVKNLGHANGAGTAGGSTGKGGKRKKGKGTAGDGIGALSKTGALMGGIQVGGEKIDGRAGPKSEAVVLSKTVDHVRTLLSDRSALLERLSEAYGRAAKLGVDVPLSTDGQAWDEPWDGSDEESDEADENGVKGEDEDEEMW